ncbi:MAG: CvpA family protein [Planctomycetota bacterium]|nr:MAG: CvpA family protein [Planctomycetota bacterium]
MQIYDIVMVIVLLLATMFGAWKGMAWQLASLGSLVVSGFVAVRFSPQLAPVISSQAPWNRFLAMLILFVLTSLGIWILFRYVRDVIDRVQLKEFDRQVGAMFGFVKGVAFCIVVTFFAVTLSASARNMVLQSRSGYYIAVLIEKADPVLPDEARAYIGKYLEELHERLDPNHSPGRYMDDNDVLVPTVGDRLREGAGAM